MIQYYKINVEYLFKEVIMEGKMDAVAVLFGDFQITNKNIQNEMLNII